MKILVSMIISSPVGDTTFQESFMKAWMENYNLTRDPDTHLVARFNTWGCKTMEGTYNNGIWILNSMGVMQGAMHADKEGFDAVLLTCFDDPLQWQLRSLIDIPVVSYGEACMTYGTMMGEKLGIVVAMDYNPARTREQINRLGLTNRVAGVRAFNIPESVLAEGYVNAEYVIEEFKKVARKLIEDGADVIIPGCGFYSPILRLAKGMEDKYPNGLDEVDGVPVMDVLSVGIQTAEMMVHLKDAGCKWISRKGRYTLPKQSMLEDGASCLVDDRMHYWDIELC